MGMRQVLTLLSIIGGLLLLSGIAAYSQGDILFVKDSAFDDPMRPPVKFHHDAHNQKAGINECSVCHHMYEDGEKLEYEASIGMECSQCHLSQNDNSKMDLIRAYHLQCRGCHLKEAAGPVFCGECHQKPDKQD
ncbi:MAG: acidic tetraheme cytochrome c3 TmcA [Desulfobacterales bacterium]